MDPVTSKKAVPCDIDFVAHFRGKSLSLPIDQHLQTVLDLMKDNQVIICEAGTGAGKTTRLPQAVLLSDLNRKVYMTQPRRDAVRWISRRIAGEMGCKEGELVGWSLAREDPRVSKETRLELLVDMSLVNRLSKVLCEDCVIIVDEAHERSIAIDLLLGLLKRDLPLHPRVRLIIASATIDTAKFSSYFNNAPVKSVDGRCFPVDVRPQSLFKDEHHSQGALRATTKVLKQFLDGTLAIESTPSENPIIVDQGTVLVLLPGKADIDNLIREAERYLKEKFNEVDETRIELLSCSSETPIADKDRVMKALRKGTLRVVFGTEILRTSITVPDTVGVIDTLEVKRLHTTPHGVSSLSKVPVSRAESKQAEGRAGRTQPGFYIPISGFGNFSYDYLAEFPVPSIKREPLTRVSLQVAKAKESMRNFDLLDRPDEANIDGALRKLQIIGALDQNEKITELGERLLNFQLDPEHALVLIRASERGPQFISLYHTIHDLIIF